MSLAKKVKGIYTSILYPNPLSYATWLAIGALLQLSALAFFPTRVASLPPLLFLCYRMFKTVIDSGQVFSGSFTTVKRGRWTAELPGLEKPVPEDGGIVCFVLGARVNHPLGPFTPGAKDCGIAFGKMWIEVETNREKWGYLGRTKALHDTSDSEGTTMIWLSYWSDLKKLQEFSTSAAHRFGAINYDKGKYPYSGIFHEAYYAPKGNWEAIYDDMPAWGLGRIGDEFGTLTRKTKSVGHSSMFQRMKRNAAIAEGSISLGERPFV